MMRYVYVNGKRQRHSQLRPYRSTFDSLSSHAKGYLALDFKPTFFSLGMNIAHKINVACSASTSSFGTGGVFRPSKRENPVVLEAEGLLKPLVKLQISDKKSLGIKTKGRQLSLLYKVEAESFKQTLDRLLTNQIINPVTGDRVASLDQYSQTFYGSVNGVDLEITLGKAALGSNELNDGDVLLKSISYAFLSAYETQALEPGSGLPTVASLAGATVTFNGMGYVNSTGFVGVVDSLQVFGGSTDVQPPASFTNLIPENPRGTVFFEPPATSPTPAAASAPSLTHFDSFTKLPLVINLAPCPNPQVMNISDLNGFSNNSPYNKFLVRADQVPYIRNRTTNSPVVLIIKERFTKFSVDTAYTAVPAITNPFVGFIYHEDTNFWQRVFVQQDYLASLLDQVVLNYVRQLHTARIVYNSLKLDSFKRKRWSEDGTVCSKGQLMPLNSCEIEYDLLVAGEHPSDKVNYITNLLFTARFASNNSNFYRSNRFITCSAFMDQSEVNDRNNYTLFKNLENAYCTEITVCQYPLIKLVPCFERGTDIQKPQSVQFRGLVSNAASTNTFP